jgi:hypothetical protein
MFFAARFPRLSPVWRELQLNKSNRTDNMDKSWGKPHAVRNAGVNKKESGRRQPGRSPGRSSGRLVLF